MRIFKHIVPLLFILATGALFWEIPRLIIIKKISCFSQFGPCSEDVSGQINLGLGKNLAQAKKIIKEKIKEDTMILDSSLQYKIPDTLTVNVIVRKARFALKTDAKYALIDKAGFIISLEGSSSLPYVTVLNFSPKIGDLLEGSKLFALNIMEELDNLDLVGAGEIKDNSLVVELTRGQTVIFPLEGDHSVLVGALRLILGSQPTAHSIDLRFKNPVIK